MKKKLLSMLLAFTLAITSVNMPVHAQNAQEQENYIVMEAVRDGVKIRDGNSKHSQDVTIVNEGDLVYIYGTTTNNAGNIWYKSKYKTETAYVYSQNLRKHEHHYETLEDMNISLCKCGAYEINSMYATGMSLAAATAGVVAAGPVVLESLGALGALGVMIVKGICVLGVAMVGGELLHLIVQSNGTAITVEHADSKADFDKSKVDIGKYYKAAVVGDGLLLVYEELGDIEDANEFLVEKLRNGAIAGNFDNVYTMTNWDAKALCQRFFANGPGCSYGKSKSYIDGSNLDAECHDKGKNLYFSHYHLFYSPYNMILNWEDAQRYAQGKIQNCHVFFGLPGCQEFV